MALAHRPLQLLGEAPFLESTGSLQDIPRAADPSLRGSAPQSADFGKVEKIGVSRFCLSGRLLSWHLLASFFLSLLRMLCLAPSGIICCGMACVAFTGVFHSFCWSCACGAALVVLYFSFSTCERHVIRQTLFKLVSHHLDTSLWMLRLRKLSSHQIRQVYQTNYNARWQNVLCISHNMYIHINI